jgi:hypothetical protein
LRPLIFWIACASILAGCGHATEASTPTPAPLLIVSRGITMSLIDVVHRIAFRPHPPRARVLSVAVIPPLGNEDTPKTRGVAFEYAAGGSKWLLSEWPSQGFVLAFGARGASAALCSPQAFSSNGVAWATRDGLAMTLQPDGPGSIQRTTGQARALFAHLACT